MPDTAVTVGDVERDFGTEIVITDASTSSTRLRFDSKEDGRTMRKMLVAMAKDLRVLIIDRLLHNMRRSPRWVGEAGALPTPRWPGGRAEAARRSLHPKRYATPRSTTWCRCGRPSATCISLAYSPRSAVSKLGLHIDATVTGRPKHLWSIYEKMVLKGREFDEIFDLVAVYAALGSIHGTWKFVVGRFKDYIAMPQFNLYHCARRWWVPRASRCRSRSPRDHDGPSGAWRALGPPTTSRG